MAQAQITTAMRKMVQAAQNEATHIPPDHLIRLALARVGQDKLGLSISTRSATESRMTLADLPEIIPDRALRLVIEGGKETTGLLILDTDMTGAIIQMQTMGRLHRIRPHHRPPTRTDAAMAVDFVDATLAGIEQEMAASPDLEWAGGFRYASWIEEGRPLATLLDEIPYRVWTINLHLGSSDATGQLIWVIPEQGCGPKPQPRLAAAAPDPSGTDPEWGEKIGNTVMESRVSLDAVLHRLSLPLSAVMTFHVGMDLPLPAAALSEIQLESHHRTLSHGRLGQLKGERAVLLTVLDEKQKPDDPASVMEDVHPLHELKIA